MGLGPHRPIRELEQAIDRGDLPMAVAIARDVTREQERSIGLDLAPRLLSLAAAQQLDAYDRWARHWLRRWLSENPQATIDQAADLAGALAELPSEPSESLAAIRRACAGDRPQL